MIPAYLVPNGVDGTTGGYSHPPVAVADVARAAREHGVRGGTVRVRGGARHPLDLGETGWGVVFPDGASAAVRGALEELVAHRQRQAGGRFRRLEYHPGETKEDFLRRHCVGPGPADPEKLPYYLLLAGSPQEIPFSFQYQLDVQYAVGRIAFDSCEDYARYARCVLDLERTPPARRRTAALFATQHPDDEVTHTCLDRLVRPLAGRLRSRLAGWELQTFFHEAATKERLASLLGGPATPDLLFTAGHGLAYRSGAPGQRPLQGALLCHGWPGPQEGRGKAIGGELFFSAEDLDGTPAAPGLLCFLLACFSAGTPGWGSSCRLPGRQEIPTAPQDFLAALPCRLLARGAAAVIGHVDTVWEDSLVWQGAGSQVPTFERTLLELLLDGLPVGEAMKHFGERYSEIATELVDCLEREKWGDGCADDVVAGLWLATQDARSYVVLGDPAVRLPA